eukprot:4165839-Pyramimonas_sp.AAC.1
MHRAEPMLGHARESSSERKGNETRPPFTGIVTQTGQPSSSVEIYNVIPKIATSNEALLDPVDTFFGYCTPVYVDGLGESVTVGILQS